MYTPTCTHNTVIMLFALLFLVIFVNFGLSSYNVNESSERTEINIYFSNPSSTDITVEVTNHDISASSRGTYFINTNTLFNSFL